jgi:hypothetical protein
MSVKNNYMISTEIEKRNLKKEEDLAENDVEGVSIQLEENNPSCSTSESTTPYSRL